jgi:hypothetical protein
MLKKDRKGAYVEVYDADRKAFRKYADHSFREYEAGAGRDSEPLREMTWDQLPVEVQNRGEAYGIVCSDATDPAEPELREYQRNVLYEKDGIAVIRQVQHWEDRFSKFEIWRKKDEHDSFDKKTCVCGYMSTDQVDKLKEFWGSKKEAWDRRYNKRMPSKEWHDKWVLDNMSLTKWMQNNGRAHLLCERLLRI